MNCCEGKCDTSDCDTSDCLCYRSDRMWHIGLSVTHRIVCDTSDCLWHIGLSIPIDCLLWHIRDTSDCDTSHCLCDTSNVTHQIVHSDWWSTVTHQRHIGLWHIALSTWHIEWNTLDCLCYTSNVTHRIVHSDWWSTVTHRIVYKSMRVGRCDTSEFAATRWIKWIICCNTMDKVNNLLQYDG